MENSWEKMKELLESGRIYIPKNLYVRPEQYYSDATLAFRYALESRHDDIADELIW